MQQGVEAIRHGKTTTGNKVGAAALKPFERTCDARNRIKQWQTPAEVFATEQKRKRRQRLSHREEVGRQAHLRIVLFFFYSSRLLLCSVAPYLSFTDPRHSLLLFDAPLFSLLL